MLLESARSCLVVVDVQERLLPAMSGRALLLDRIALLVKAARRLGVPVLATEQYPKGLGRTVPELVALLPPGEAIAKVAFACTGEPAFLDRLQETRRRQAVICGIEAHVCVLQTALDLRARGFDTFVVADATGSRTPDNAAAGLRRMERDGVAIVTSEMVVFEWLGRAGTPEFKELSALVK